MNRRRFFAALIAVPAALLALGRERRGVNPNAWWNYNGPFLRATDGAIHSVGMGPNHFHRMYERVRRDGAGGATVRFKSKNVSIPIRYFDETGELTAMLEREAAREKSQIIASLREDLFRG